MSYVDIALNEEDVIGPAIREHALAQLQAHFDLDLSSKVLVVGIGITGVSVANFLAKLQLRYAMVDSRSKPPLMTDFITKYPEVPVFTGGFDASAFAVATHIIVSPGVTLDEQPIRQAIQRGAICLSDIDIFACAVGATPVIAITGSNGKSTVTTMVGDMVKAAGKKVGVGGNLGTPALDLVAADVAMYVLELSSFQLERTRLLNAAAATVLNVSADHLDRHEGMGDYAKQKSHVFNGDGVMVLNVEDPEVVAMARAGRKQLTFGLAGTGADFSVLSVEGREFLAHDAQPLLAIADLPLEGSHNVANALAALALGHAVGLCADVMCRALKKFKGLAHRMQKVAVVRDVTWINDSKATNIGACVAALQGYQRPIVLIAGGDAKGADMQELVPAVKAKVKAVVLMGKDAPLIEQALNGCVPAYPANNMQQAVKIAAELALAGDAVLLSPACASLDQYRDYKDRGNQFAKAVQELPA